MRIGPYRLSTSIHEDRIVLYWGLYEGEYPAWRKVWLTPRVLSGILPFLAHLQQPNAHIYNRRFV